MGGCGGLERMQAAERGARLNDQLRVYGKLIRWREFEAARRYVRPQPEVAGRAPEPSPRLLSHINVTLYRLQRVELDERGKRAAVTHSLRFYHEDNRREIATTDRQIWWWSDATSRWYLHGNVPDFAGALRS